MELINHSGFQLEVTALPPRPWGHLAMSGDIFDCQDWKGEGWSCHWHLVVKGKDTAKYPSIHRTVPDNK